MAAVPGVVTAIGVFLHHVLGRRVVLDEIIDPDDLAIADDIFLAAEPERCSERVLVDVAVRRGVVERGMLPIDPGIDNAHHDIFTAGG